MAKVATLRLRSSCVSPDRIGDAINHSKGKFGEQVAGSGSSAAANNNNDNVSVPRTSITAEFYRTASDHKYRDSPNGKQSVMPSSHSPMTMFESFHTHAHYRKKHKNSRDDFDYVSSFPIQCDVSLIPRLPITINDGRNNIDAFHDSIKPAKIFNATPTQQRRQQRGSSGTVMHFPRQTFLPCGMNNVISIDQLLPPSTLGPEDHDIDVPFLLSLTQCVVKTDHYDGVIIEPTLFSSDESLPVLASPSTFQFYFHSDSSSDARTRLGKLIVGEIDVSFDFSIALEYYREITRHKHHHNCKDHDQGATCGLPRNDFDSDATLSTPSIPYSQMNEAVASLQKSIMSESLLLAKALLLLGCTGIVFIISLVWAIRRIVSDNGRRLKGRRSKRLMSNVTVPNEIGVLDKSSTKHSSAGNDRAIPFLTSTVGHGDLSPMQSSGEMVTGAMTIHETLHLISPLASPSQVKNISHNERCSKESSSNWYDDLSPPCVQNKRHGRSRSDLTPSLKSVFGNRTTGENECPNEEVFDLRLSSQMKSNSAFDEVSLGDGAGKTSQSTEMSSLSDACDDFLNISVANGNSTSRQYLSDLAALQDQRNVTLSKSPSSTGHASDDAGPLFASVDKSDKNECSPSVETIYSQENTVCYDDLEDSCAIAPGQKLVYGRKSLNVFPKIAMETVQSPSRLAAELVKRATVTKAPSLDAASKDFLTLRAQGVFEIETEKFPSIPALEDNSFASSLAKRVAEMESARTSPATAQMKACTPETTSETYLHKRKPLTPLGSSESSRTGTTTDQFLSDYW